MLLLIPTFFFTITIFLTSFFFLILLLHHYRHLCNIHLSNSFLSFRWLHLPHWFEPPPQRSRRHLLGSDNIMTLKGATSQACAACKYQRRKCTPECPLAPYFPPDQPKMFQNAHKLFGVCNILKILKSVDPCLKFETMKSIIYQANIRDKFPVYGCWEVIWQLQYQIMVAEQELQNVHKQLALYRQHHYQQQQQISSMQDYVTSQLELGMAPPNNNNTISLLHHSTPQSYDNNNTAIPHALPVTQQQQQQQPYSHRSDDAYTCAYDIDSKENITGENVLWAQNPFTNNNSSINENNDNAETVQSQFGVSQRLAIESEDVQDYDELHPFFDTIDDRQSYIDSKEAYDSSSSEESFKDTTQLSMDHAAENTLKSAAACFSLTSVKLSVS
ncbi:LOB domain-containing protein 27-like [Rosa rugosa]|uniref:LOB domain-containing protein 27-like n=1 Tax=Rosa rugosa TaxID=74645 RepID=UPI002B40C14B|nr:LOB domain-containing protein 27-like [Rosa rugosa]